MERYSPLLIRWDKVREVREVREMSEVREVREVYLTKVKIFDGSWELGCIIGALWSEDI